MRGKLFVAALMATTALTPRPAHAAPVIGFIQGAVAALAGSAVLGGSYLATAGFAAGAIAGGYVGAFLGTFVGRILLSVGLSYLSASLNQPNTPPPSQIYRNYAQDISYFVWVLGKTRVGGPLGFTGTSRVADPVTGDKRYRRHYSPIFAAHSCDGVVAHFLDEREVEIDSDGLVVTEPYAWSDSYLTGVPPNLTVHTETGSMVRIRPFTGQPGQTADAALVAMFTEITSEFDFAGLTGAHIWAGKPKDEDFTKIYPTGREPSYTPVIRGMDTIYDPRTDSYGYSDNAALILAAWLTKVWAKSVDWDEVAVEADVCDELVTNRDGIQQKRWTIGWSFSDDTDFETQRAQLCGACDAFICERADGKIGFKVGRYEEPTITLTGDDIISISVSEGGMGADLPTEIVAAYTEPANAWREATTGPYVITEDERLVTDEPKVYAVTSHNQAARICKRIARVKRASRQYQLTLSGAGFDLFGQRFVRIQSGVWDDVIEVGEFGIDGGVFYLNGTSCTADDFSFNAAIEEPTPPSYQSVASDDTIEVVSGFSGAAQDGGSVMFSWDRQPRDLKQEIQLREPGGDWLTYTAPSRQYQLTVTGFSDGTQIEAQIRNRTSGGSVSDWSSSISVTVTENTVAPSALAAFTPVADGYNVDVNFTSPDDPNYFATRIYRGDTTVFADASLIRTEYGAINAADSYTDEMLATGTYYYWGVPINSSGIPADDDTLPANGSGPIEITI